ncbi:hypothetical protein [Clostridium botulinum]|nr:hypothetical protein [Clostridium botulinum]
MEVLELIVIRSKSFNKVFIDISGLKYDNYVNNGKMMKTFLEF